MNIKVLIMCGGKGRRLGKLTENIPKPLMKINKKTIIDYKLQIYKRYGLTDYIFCIGFQGRKIIQYMKDIKVEAQYSDSGEKAGILKRIFDAKEKIGNTTIISYGDTFAQINFSELIHSHRNSKFILTLVVAPMVNPFGIVEWNLDNCVTNFIEKPILNHYIGYMVIDKRIFDYINEDIINLPDGQGIVSMIKLLSSMEKVGIYKYDGLQFTVNTKLELEEANDVMGKYYTI